MPSPFKRRVDALVCAAIVVSVSACGGSPSPIIMFETAPLVGSDVGNRAAADAACKTVSAAKGKTNVRAFISYSAGNDVINNMPTNYKVPTNAVVNTASGTKLAANWADLMDGTIIATLKSGGIGGSGPAGVEVYWTGSTSTGALSAGYNCNDWSTKSASGMAGFSGDATGSWLENDIDSCASSHPILCIAFD